MLQRSARLLAELFPGFVPPADLPPDKAEGLDEREETSTSTCHDSRSGSSCTSLQSPLGSPQPSGHLDDEADAVETAFEVSDEDEDAGDYNVHGDDPRYLPACVEWSGATAYFRPMAHFERYYVLGDVLGLCDNGVVRRGHSRFRQYKDVAVKSIFCDCQAVERAARRELDVMVAVRELPGCLGGGGGHFDLNGGGRGLHYLLSMKLLEGRDLLSVLKARSRPLAEADVRIIAQRVLAALQALHAAGRNHGNVKSNNVGLMEKGDYRTTVIFDWETSQLESEWPEFQGNPAFAAPEALRNGRTGKHYSTALADAYSVGVTLFQLLTGQLPVRAMCASADKSGGDESRRWKRRLRRWEHALLEKGSGLAADVARRLANRGVSPACQDLIIGLLALQEAERLSVSQALQHPWMMQF